MGVRGTIVNAVAILAIGVLLLDIKRPQVANLFPALVVAVLLTMARESLGW